MTFPHSKMSLKFYEMKKKKRGVISNLRFKHIGLTETQPNQTYTQTAQTKPN